MKNILAKLSKIQTELKAPKGQFNSFGKYKYRNAEDILEAVKPLLKKYNCTLTASDEMINIENSHEDTTKTETKTVNFLKRGITTPKVEEKESEPETTRRGVTYSLEEMSTKETARTYVQATVTLYDADSAEYISTSASAREAYAKKGMDESQVTGATSSYARKYALNGLFAIDDTKDADSQDNSKAGTFTEEHMKKIETINTLDELKIYYAKNKGFGKDFAKAITERKAEIMASGTGYAGVAQCP